MLTLPEMRFDINTPQTRDLSMAIAPDGQTLAFAAASESGPRLWLRSMASGTAQPLAGTEGAGYPFWSPDSRSVGFFAEDKLKRVDVVGGGVPGARKCTLRYRGGAWNRDGTILFGTASGGPIVRVSETGGEPAAVTPEGQPGQDIFPEFLPDGRHFLYHVQNIAEPGIYVGQIEGGETRRLLASDSSGGVQRPIGTTVLHPAGHAVRAELHCLRLELTGNPYPIAGGALSGTVSVSATGAVAYRPGGRDRKRSATFDLVRPVRPGD